MAILLPVARLRATAHVDDIDEVLEEAMEPSNGT